MYNGITGKRMEVKIFIGNIYYLEIEIYGRKQNAWKSFWKSCTCLQDSQLKEDQEEEH